MEAHREVMQDMVKSLSLCGHTAMEKETEPWIFLGWGINLPVQTLADYYEIPEYTTLVSVLLNGHKVDWMPWEKLILGHHYFFLSLISFYVVFHFINRVSLVNFLLLAVAGLPKTEAFDSLK